MPDAAQKIWQFLGYNTQLEKQQWTKVLKESIPENQSLPEPKVLFRKIEDDEIEKAIKKLGVRS